ncbi:protein ImuA [Rhizobiales bacterium GAS188]|nr:protein ImuA [Rhizobiales bacterium GAS188]
MPSHTHATEAALCELKARIERIAAPARARDYLPFGVTQIDAHLPGGGLALGAVHEISEDGPRGIYAPMASLFAAGILARLDGPVLWCLKRRDLFAPALARVGLHPDRVIYCETWKDGELLPAMEEGLRHKGLAAVVGEVNRLPLTPSRRLQLAAEASGVTAIVLRRSYPANDEANAAFSRWRISAAPSEPDEVGEMGRARWHIELLRCRGAEAHSWTVEACDASGRIALPADLSAGQVAPEERWRASA